MIVERVGGRRNMGEKKEELINKRKENVVVAPSNYGE